MVPSSLSKAQLLPQNCHRPQKGASLIQSRARKLGKRQRKTNWRSLFFDLSLTRCGESEMTFFFFFAHVTRRERRGTNLEQREEKTVKAVELMIMPGSYLSRRPMWVFVIGKEVHFFSFLNVLRRKRAEATRPLSLSSLKSQRYSGSFNTLLIRAVPVRTVPHEKKSESRNTT